MSTRLVNSGVMFVVALVLATPLATAQNLTDDVVKKLAAPLIKNRVADGLSIGYISGDHYGTVHLGSATASGKPADNLTVYELGSFSKVFTAILLADAVTRGDIDMMQPADTTNAAGIKLPSHNGKPIRWIDLSTHRSGLSRLPANLAVTSLENPYRYYDSKNAAAALQALVLTRSPGDKQEYSNFGTAVLGYFVAEKQGRTYQQLLRDRIATPLNMTDCTVEISDDQQKRSATPHSSVGTATPAWTFADLPGAGGVRATLRDMMRFAKAQLVPPKDELGKAIELAWQQHTAADASGPAMGLGWMIAGDGQTRWHNGQTGGSHSAVFINRELKTAVVVLCNTGTDIDQLAVQLIQTSAGMEVDQGSDDSTTTPAGESDAAKSDVDAKHRARLVGKYQLTPNFIFDVQDRDGHLMVGITNQPTQEVFPDSPARWSYRGVAATLEFHLPKTGKADYLTLHQNGAAQKAKRIK